MPSVNWNSISSSGNAHALQGFIAYKVGMSTALVKDNSEKSMSPKKQIALPVTILELPHMKIYSVRFYKNGKVMKDFIVSNDKEMKRKVKVTKIIKNLDNVPEEYDDIRIIAYSIVKQTSIKKTPDLIEIAINSDNKLEFIKNLVGKEISLDYFVKNDLIDARGLTKGKGLQGPVKRFGIKLKFHKSEKGVRRPGSLGPWHPARVTFKAPMAGQLGLFSRIIHNLRVLHCGRISEKDINPKNGFKNYGKIKTSYLIVKGSVQGPEKRQLLITSAFRPSKSQQRKKYEFLELVKWN